MLTSEENIDSTTEYKIERLTEDRLEDLSNLHSKVYSSVSYDWYRKKYDTAYTGIQYVGFIAYNISGQPIAYYGVIPCFIEYENRIILVAQSADTMTHPEHRYKGMFVKLANMTYQLCSVLGIHLIFGFPNQHSYMGLIRTGWELKDRMDYFTIPVSKSPLKFLFSRSRIFKKKYDQYCASVLKKITVPVKGIPNSFIAEGYAGISRAEGYLQYKTYSHTIVIDLSRVRLWIKIGKSLTVGDIENINEQNFFAVINQLKKIGKKIGVSNIQFHSTRGSRLHQLFSNRYNAKPSFLVLFKTLRPGIAAERIKFTFADIDIF